MTGSEDDEHAQVTRGERIHQSGSSIAAAGASGLERRERSRNRLMRLLLDRCARQYAWRCAGCRPGASSTTPLRLAKRVIEQFAQLLR
jgi:hypothetical protein